jgi:aspartyl-tRNA(Asn)/glutamyl-tRNA(Gln) amidotransferase subunit B
MHAATRFVAHHSSPIQQPYICRACLRRLQASQSSNRLFSLSRSRTRELEPRVEPTKAPPPLRKQLKDEAKQKKRESSLRKTNHGAENASLEKWELTVGIEIHAQLNTAKKLFSTAATSINDPPNTHVAPFDIAIPGTQPQFQKETLVPALRAALALNCQIQRKSAFDRKHYFYHDQPAGYQITQYYGNELFPKICRYILLVG